MGVGHHLQYEVGVKDLTMSSIKKLSLNMILFKIYVSDDDLVPLIFRHPVNVDGDK